jgi:hypothetical protein
MLKKGDNKKSGSGIAIWEDVRRRWKRELDCGFGFEIMIQSVWVHWQIISQMQFETIGRLSDRRGIQTPC